MSSSRSSHATGTKLSMSHTWIRFAVSPTAMYRPLGWKATATAGDRRPASNLLVCLSVSQTTTVESSPAATSDPSGPNCTDITSSLCGSDACARSPGIFMSMSMIFVPAVVAEVPGMAVEDAAHMQESKFPLMSPVKDRSMQKPSPTSPKPTIFVILMVPADFSMRGSGGLSRVALDFEGLRCGFDVSSAPAVLAPPPASEEASKEYTCTDLPREQLYASLPWFVSATKLTQRPTAGNWYTSCPVCACQMDTLASSSPVAIHRESGDQAIDLMAEGACTDDAKPNCSLTRRT
mmetsp:Transcript_95234/g.275259  ORF Transcript_95234/g.275259 Transcript_95234/m.275259 type:complete len:292 (+) Transcript_95234:1993-2868(+)